MKLTVYNRENSRPAEVNYQGKRTINLNRTGAIYLSKTLSVEMGIAGGEGVNFANDEETGGWYICRTTDKSGFTVWKDKRCARFFKRIYGPQADGTGKGGMQERSVHGSQDAGGDGRDYLLQDYPVQFHCQIIRHIPCRIP